MHKMHDAFSASGEYLSRSQVAELFDVSPSTVTRWADEGKLTHVRTLGGHRRYLANDVLELVRMLTKETRMETFATEIPKLYGDHHVLAIQQLLADLDGIQDIQASAAAHRLTVVFDPERCSGEIIHKRLTAGGYPSLHDHPQPEENAGRKDPAWASLGVRMTQTHSADR